MLDRTVDFSLVFITASKIKFWSKRTILDIVLASVATASTIIAELLGAGLLHF